MKQDTDNDLILAIQAAWLAGHRELAAELAAQRSLTTCIRCGGSGAVPEMSRLSAIPYGARAVWWRTCTPCEQLTCDEETADYHRRMDHTWLR